MTANWPRTTLHLLQQVKSNYNDALRLIYMGANSKAGIQAAIDQNKRNLEQLRNSVKDEQYKISVMTNSPTNKAAKQYCRDRIKKLRKQMEPIKAEIKRLQEQKKRM